MSKGLTTHESSSSDHDSRQAFFNVILKDAGVRGVKVQELYSLDSDMLATLPYDLVTKLDHGSH
jgi:hypothetical protein